MDDKDFAPEVEEKDIDLLTILKKIWDNKKLVGLWCLAGLVVGLVIAFSIPREYTTKVMLAPENSGKSSGNLGALAAMAGVNIGSSGADAMSPNLYPDIVKSVPFGLSLLNVPLTDKEEKRKFTVTEYLDNDVQAPWWSAITGFPRKIMGALSSGDGDNSMVEGNEGSDPFKLTKQETSLLGRLNNMINVSVDVKTNVITVSVTMQDPMVSAILADTVVNRLQEYVTEYRTNKARKDLEYIEKLNLEAKEAYYAAQQKYANYLDTHQGMVMYSAQTMRDRLENEATLAFNMFNQTSQQLQMAKAKVQEQTPVYTIISPATVPTRPSAPRKGLILVGFIFLGFIGSVVWVLLVRPLRAAIKAEEHEEKHKNDEEVD